MHVGYAPLFQNPGNALPDAEVYRQELRLAEMAEPLGFDSIWSVEHHFTDYTTHRSPKFGGKSQIALSSGDD
jgi:alkanesulfonate monooxygenase SsuD/methylene tetrahydromethanopterin reductase-like flavin-dependent oxidoreductase (luciferase family)